MSYKRATLYAAQQAGTVQTMQQQRDSAKSLFQFCLDSFGQSVTSRFAGLTATPGTGLTVNIGPGSVYQYLPIDPTAQSTLSQDTSSWLLQGLVTAAATNLTGFAAPGTAGQSINYLIECQIVVTDLANVSTNFYNSTTPGTPTVLQKSPARQNQVNFQVKAGTAATTGSQVSPTADAGWIPLWIAQVNNGQTTIPSGQITLAASAPQFTGFVPLGSGSNVLLSPGAAQTGFINVTGNITSGATLVGATSLLGPSAITVAGYSNAALGGFTVDKLNVSATQTMNGNASASIAIAGAIAYSGAQLGTDASPYPASQINAAMFGGKVPADYALASGNYVTVYAGVPTLATGNAGVTGYLQSGVATGTAPLIVASTTMVANLNAGLLGGFPAGNAATNIPISNGTLCTNLNAQYLNGLASSAYQLAGNYATMNTTNTGSFTATGNLITTGASGSSQLTVSYSASNGFGLNSGGALAYVQANAAPLGLIGSSIRTNGPLYVGDATPQNVNCKDLVPSGLLRSGQCVYRVSYSTTNSYPIPGGSGVSDFGYEATANGAIHISFDDTGSGQFYVGYRAKVTFGSNLTATFNSIGNTNMGVYVDGSYVGNTVTSLQYTFSTGTHNVDLIFTSHSMGQEYYLGSGGAAHPQGGDVTLFGWLPMPLGILTSTVTAILPG